MRPHLPKPRSDSPAVSDEDPIRLTDGPSAYALAQESAEVKGLTLQTDGTLEKIRALQRQAGHLASEQLQQRDRKRTTRITLLAVATVGLWLATLIVLLENL